MKSSGKPALVLGILFLGWISSVVLTTGELPDRMATHFDGDGLPNGWMSRAAYLSFILIFGVTFPLVVVAPFFGLRFLPNGAFNLPHRDYWLAPERRAETMAYLFRQSLWFACLGVGFTIGLHGLIWQANAETPARLSTPGLLALMGSFLAAMGLWVLALVRHFYRPAVEKTANP